MAIKETARRKKQTRCSKEKRESQPFGGSAREGGGPGSYGIIIPNRKRDKANKTLSGRRSANRAPSGTERRGKGREED